MLSSSSIFQGEGDQESRDRLKLGVCELVPPNTEDIWCSPMIITRKKNGESRRIVDLRHLNKSTARKTHGGETPLCLATSVPAGTFRTTLDAWKSDGGDT